MTDDELRQLDREIAELLGWTTEQFKFIDGTCWRDRDGKLWPSLPCFSGGGGMVMEAEARWVGFGLLVEECERRRWLHETHYLGRYWESGETPTPCGRVSSPPPGQFWCFERTGNDIRHAFALAMRDALRAAKEREG